ncbi:MAG: LemA family protein [Candidatus Saganbacteria bacterium]|nr:LemA family protein [Candidatus Saganbacteria bacterium]
MSKGIMWLIGIAGILLVAVLWVITSYNGLVSKDVAVTTAWAQVETQYQRRLDLIPNLVETVKGYKIHEADVFKSIAQSRAKLAGARTVSEKVEATNGLEGALSRLLMIVENYPTLKADANFRQLMDSLEGTENRISYARGQYNEAVQVYNISTRRFPTNIIAGMFGFEKVKPMFEAQKGADQAPKVKF